jgi:hypothetical protein
MVLLFCNATTILAETIDHGIDILRTNPDYGSAVTVSCYNMWSLFLPVKAREDCPRRDLEPVARYQKDNVGTRESQGTLLHIRVCGAKPTSGEGLQMVLREADQPIIPEKQGNAYGGKELTGESLEQGHIVHTQRWVKNVNKTVFITYYNDKEIPLKSRMRGNLTSGSVSGLIVGPDEDFRRRWL